MASLPDLNNYEILKLNYGYGLSRIDSPLVLGFGVSETDDGNFYFYERDSRRERGHLNVHAHIFATRSESTVRDEDKENMNDLSQWWGDHAEGFTTAGGTVVLPPTYPFTLEEAYYIFATIVKQWDERRKPSFGTLKL